MTNNGKNDTRARVKYEMKTKCIMDEHEMGVLTHL